MRKAKAALSSQGGVDNAAHNTRIIKAGTPRRIPRPAGHLLVFCASPTRNGLYDLGLFTGTGVLDKVPDVDDAIGAGVGALEASVMRLYSVVVILARRVRVVRYSHGVNLLCRLAGLREVPAPR